MTSRKLPSASVLAEEYRNGDQFTDIANRYGVTVSAVSACFKKEKIDRTRKCQGCDNSVTETGPGAYAPGLLSVLTPL